MESFLAFADGAPVAALLLAAIVVTSVIGLGMAPRLLERCVLRPYWLVRNGEWPTVVTSTLVHADFAHLLFNAFTFWAFAFALERTIGSARFAALYAAGVLASAAGTWLQHREEPRYRTLGASGAILAVLFASIVYHPKSSLYLLPLPVPIPAPVFAVGYLAYTVFAAQRGRGSVNHDAHLSGALVGLAFVALTDAPAFVRAWHLLWS